MGRPNVGKSSILNRLLGRGAGRGLGRCPGTTRDAVDRRSRRAGERYLFVDTAGIRRVRLLKENVDHVSVVQARRAIERADVAMLVLDAESRAARDGRDDRRATSQEAGRGVVIAVNKWDLADERKLAERAFETDVRDHLKFLPWAPVVFISAKTGRGHRVAAATRSTRVHAARTSRGHDRRAQPRCWPSAADKHAPQGRPRATRPVKILFGSQIGMAPPTFALSINQPVDLHFSYRRYLENQIREAFGFEGTPIRLKVRQRRRKGRS